MSSPVRHTFHAAPAASGSTRDDPAAPPHAFDLFLPEPDGVPSGALTPAPAALDFPDHQFARRVARALDAPATEIRLPLGGIAPTDREVASARALMVGWAAACGIAVFAFFSQGPSLSPRESQVAAPVVAAASVEKPRSGGDITLPASAGPAAAEAKPAQRSSRSPGKRTPAPAAADAQPQLRR